MCYVLSIKRGEVSRSVAFGDVIGYWLLVIGGRASALHFAGLKSRLQKFSILNPQFLPEEG